MGIGKIFFHQNLTSIQRQTRDKWGDLSTTSLYTNVPTRFVYDTTRTRGVAEDERVDALAYINGTYTAIQPDDIVTYAGNTYMVVKVFLEYDLFGNIDHIKMSLRARG
jgi:hypothetical protein